ELADRGLVDLAEADPALLVERRPPHLLEELLHHGADAHHLGRLGDGLDRRRGLLLPVGAAATVGHHDELGRLGRLGVGHGPFRSPDQARAANKGTSISADVSEPWRLRRWTSPVSPGSRNATASRAAMTTSPSRE